MVAHFPSSVSVLVDAARLVRQCYDCADLKAVNCKVPSHGEFQLWKCVSDQGDDSGLMISARGWLTGLLAELR